MAVWISRIVGFEVSDLEFGTLISTFYYCICRERRISEETAMTLHLRVERPNPLLPYRQAHLCSVSAASR
jgi:hypothetical protein